ncbi:MAG TPA: efflux RND transporter periplasmic adaptor subunit [Sporichthyaceae bacterium]
MLPSVLRDRKTVLLRRGVPIALGGIVITGTGMAWAGHGDSAPEYRTGLASVGSVDQLVTLTGTVAKLTQEDASFGVSGTVKKVEVASGDKVSAGEVLAELDPSDLDAAVTAAEATLARAKATLETDQTAADASTSSSTTSSSSSSSTKSTPSPSPSPTPSTGSDKPGSGKGAGTGTGASTTVGGVDLAAPTRAVVTALAKATADLQKVSDAVKARDTACDPVFNAGSTDTGSGDSTPSPDPSGDPTSDPSAAPTDSADPTPSATPSSDSETHTTSVETSDSTSTSDLQSCIDAMKAVSDLQDAVATDQNDVQTKETALQTAMDQAVANLKAQPTGNTGGAGTGTGTGTGSGTGTGTGTGTGATGSTGKGGSGTGSKGSTGGTGSGASTTTGGSGSGGRGGQTLDPVDAAARVAVDNAAILAAQAALESAQEDREEAVLTAPIDGIVGSVGITKSSSASTSNTITILGNGAVKVSLDVPATTAAKLKKGMTAQVTADGASAPSAGTVDSIGILPSSSNGSSTYPVVIVVPNPADGLAEGAAATVAITLKAVSNVVTVPNSAVTATGTGANGFVVLMQNGKATRQTVTTGAVGSTVTEITSGVTAGQSVVIADPSQDVPASNTSTNTRGFGGGGLGGGTFTGGAAGGNFGGGANGGGARRGG